MCLLGGVLTFSVLACSELPFSDSLSTACSVGGHISGRGHISGCGHVSGCD